MDMSNMQCKNVTFLSYKEENSLYKYTFKIMQMATFFGRFCGAKRPRCVASGQIVFDL